MPDYIDVLVTDTFEEWRVKTNQIGAIIDAVEKAEGPAGPAGADGFTGADGVDGADGADGADGVAGTQGNIGPQGPQGLTGNTGPTGPQGLQGPTGADDITSQISTAVSGLATTNYVDTSYSGAFFRNITSISKFDQVANTEYEYDVTSTAFGSLTAERVTGIHVMCYTRSDNGETGGAVISTNLGGNTAFDPIKSQYDYEDAGSGAMVFIPMTRTQAKFKLKMSRTGNDDERYRKGWVIRGVSYVENI
jgi:hypothetical protein